MNAAALTQRIAALPTKQKFAAALIAGGIFFMGSLFCCTGTGVYVGMGVGESREKARIKAEHEKFAEETKKAFSKIFNVPVVPKEVKPSEWLTPDRAAIADGIQVELVKGAIGKIQIRNSFSRNSTYQSKEVFFQVYLRITNNKKNYVLQYSPWSDRNGTVLGDEHGNKFRKSYHQSNDLADGADYKNHRVDPGKSVDDLLVFDSPLDSSKEFTLVLDGTPIHRDDVTIGYKIPRSFFEK